jgi:hypothetical protein
LLLPIIAYTLSSTKLEIRGKIVFTRYRGGWGERERAEWVVREGLGAGGRNNPSIVCTYEY